MVPTVHPLMLVIHALPEAFSEALARAYYAVVCIWSMVGVWAAALRSVVFLRLKM